MSWFVYIMADSAKEQLHAGVCNDLDNTIAFYQMMPTMAMDENYRQNQLVYLEQGQYEKQVQDRLKVVARLTKKEKKELVETINPAWIELVPGVNMEL